MDTKQKKPYQKPTMDVVWLDMCKPLLVGSNLDTRSGGINPWYDTGDTDSETIDM